MTAQMPEDMQAELIAALDAATSLSLEQRTRIAAFGALLLQANRRVNLTGAKDVTALVPHLIDSLAVLPYVGSSLVDIGSGGGLPAIPLAIVTGASCTMIDAVGKKTTFLRSVIDTLGLEARALNGRAESLAFDPELRETFQTATARAVALAPTVLEYTMPFLALGGRAILQRGALEERERQATADAALMLGGKLTDEIELEGSRRLLIIEKHKPTPIRFPRKAGVPAKRPLCI